MCQRVNRRDGARKYNPALLLHTEISFDEDASANCRNRARISKIQLRRRARSLDPLTPMRGPRNQLINASSNCAQQLGSPTFRGKIEIQVRIHSPRQITNKLRHFRRNNARNSAPQSEPRTKTTYNTLARKTLSLDAATWLATA